ncbi:MAG: hypothetical protein WA488_16960 [Mycobacterium sp.]|uniref:alpha/beta fold hydrolase n=1 Tax=Mycobacterium sp. TaxID=1785 RepID=UPI003BB6B58E
MNTRMAQTYLQTPTEVISTADGVDFAYRRTGSGGEVPLVLGGYFASNMDDWDPLIVDGLAADREVIAFDYPGIGGSVVDDTYGRRYFRSWSQPARLSLSSPTIRGVGGCWAEQP